MTDRVAWTVAAPGPLHEPTVWRVPLTLDEAGRHACLAALSDEERQRTTRFLRQEDRDRYAASHAALRRILAGALAADPADVRFLADEAGKPELDGPWRGHLAFNLSHSGGVGLIALSPDARIGVDVERIRPIPDCLSLARSYFAAGEVSALQRLPAEALQTAFYACWTRKEAFVKALGLGLAFPLDRFAVSIPPAAAALLSIDGSADAARAWSLQHLAPAPGHVAAVAIEAPGRTCALRSLMPDWSSGPA
ncbi:4'-phosphopantetheinyl transferase family protein [Methylobacterium haplocladii]|uniref:Uncharacterized protein n=1 Tax=Methylobacterium haplocladii TaxID=1176176 RepID=A0A512IPT2_9HYPH|nr:4'-phosphopantetheinyl transferase superfamily protein [Methylobacterium haplocladii]GEO99690.1 hypothetical protein MHA02_20780 [Methylobacterium haplocladii]GJD84679.1 4'-phosphopantetheinyl transferase Sfp [Methylobacterium haplocladii]GLS61204.1 hypothetical protein GCM10007887_39020 [Methylobacterium haplocladii]